MKRSRASDDDDAGAAAAHKRARVCILNVLPNDMLVCVAEFLDARDGRSFALTSRLFRRAAWRAFDPTPLFEHACRRGYADIVERLLADARASWPCCLRTTESTPRNGTA
jgi:hypothetical protein